jgi:hypothetical protein
MAKSNIRRIPFILNLDDPIDAAIWEVLEPLLTRRRASQFIRGAIAQALGMGGGSPPLELRTPPALSVPRAKRAAQTMPQLPAGDGKSASGDDPDALEQAADNFLNAFSGM